MRAVILVLHVRPILDVLVEIADVAADLVPGLEGKRYYRDEAEGEPLPVLWGEVVSGIFIAISL